MKIVPTKWYTTRETADFLKIHEDTVKKYCRDQKKYKIEAKQVGPKKRWHVKGGSIIGKLREWSME